MAKQVAVLNRTVFNVGFKLSSFAIM